MNLMPLLCMNQMSSLLEKPLNLNFNWETSKKVKSCLIKESRTVFSLLLPISKILQILLITSIMTLILLLNGTQRAYSVI